MAKKISQLPTVTTITDDDYLMTVDAPAGTPVTSKITVGNARAGLIDNLSGVTNAATARTNLGLGTAATQGSGAFDAAGAATAAVANHEADTTAVHGITNTSLLETTAGAQAKVDTHSADTTAVHGIADTAPLQAIAARRGPPPTGVAATDTAALQAFIDASSPGDRLVFPAGVYLVNATIRLKARRWYEGATVADSVLTGSTIFQMADGANLDAVIASEEWFSASATPSVGLPAHIEKIFIYGNKSNQTAGAGHGLVWMNYFSNIKDVVVRSTRGDGIRITSQTLAGNGITNTCVGNNIDNCRADSTDGNGFYSHEHDATARVTDGYMTRCSFYDTVESGIRIDGSAGWWLSGNHTWDNDKNGIRIGRAWRTRVLGNYVEGYGRSTTVAEYAGIDLYNSPMIGEVNHICDNVVSVVFAPATGTSVRGINVRTTNDGEAWVVISGNGLVGETHTTSTQGVKISSQNSGSITHAVLSNNNVTDFNTQYSMGSTGTIIVAASANLGMVAQAPTFSATPTIHAQQVEAGAGLWTSTLTANVTAITLNDGYDGQRISLVFTQDATGGRTVAWPSNIINAPTVNPAASATTIVRLTYLATLDKWVA